MDKLDCFIMWIKDRSRRVMVEELQHLDHKVIDGWVHHFQEVLSGWFEVKVAAGLCPLSWTADDADQVTMKKPSAATSKKPAANGGGSSVKARPAVQCKRPAIKTLRMKPAARQKVRNHALRKRVLIADESYLNKNRPGKLSKHGRPKKDQIWIWGAVLQGSIRNHFIFRILKHPSDAINGRPRGHQEMVNNLQLLGLRPGDIFVSDKWRASLSALKEVRRELGVSEAQLRHEVVNHSDGELVNKKVYTTNPIEAKWYLIKRWVKSKSGGKLPSHSDRERWHMLINEYQARQFLSIGSAFDYDNYFTVPVRKMCKIFSKSFS